MIVYSLRAVTTVACNALLLVSDGVPIISICFDIFSFLLGTGPFESVFIKFDLSKIGGSVPYQWGKILTEFA